MSTTESTPFSRAVSAEIRAQIAGREITGQALAKRIGRSQNYVAARLRGAAPFNLADIGLIADTLGVSAMDLIGGASRWDSSQPAPVPPEIDAMLSKGGRKVERKSPRTRTRKQGGKRDAG